MWTLLTMSCTVLGVLDWATTVVLEPGPLTVPGLLLNDGHALTCSSACCPRQAGLQRLCCVALCTAANLRWQAAELFGRCLMPLMQRRTHLDSWGLVSISLASQHMGNAQRTYILSDRSHNGRLGVSGFLCYEGPVLPALPPGQLPRV